MRIGIITASRGLVFSKTMESIFSNIKGRDCELYMAHDLPIPDCFNTPLKKALDDGCDLIWFVEEDMLIPEGTLDKMIKLYLKGNKVISSEYADRRTGKSFVERDNEGNVLYAGMGCLLVDANLMRELSPDYIQTCVFWIKNEDGVKYLEPHPEIENKGYGTQDIWLNWKLRQLGHNISLVEAKIGHLRLTKTGEDNNNKGTHLIETVYVT